MPSASGHGWSDCAMVLVREKLNIYPEFHLVRHVTSRRVQRVEQVETSESSRAVPTWRTTNKL